jgi:RNA polymerase sigma-70 factor (ECF subfamily)
LRELPSDPSELGRAVSAKEPSPQHVVETRELDRKLAIAFDRLPPRYRAAMALRVDAGFSVEQIAQALDCPAGTVKTLLFRARELMRAWSDGGRP